MKKLTLTIIILIFIGKVFSQSATNYHICQGDSLTMIQSNTFTVNGVQIIGLSDDNIVGPYNIGFPFCFYGNTYSQFNVGSNGFISFTGGQTNGFNIFEIPSTNAGVPKNAIMACWQDLNPVFSGNVSWALIGTAPNRKLLVTYTNIAHFSCVALTSTTQIVLHETTNIIETNILNKPICSGWNNGRAVHGLHNINGTIATVVPGRNNTEFEVTNETKIFTPQYGGSACNTITGYAISDAPFFFYNQTAFDSIEWFALPNTSTVLSTNFQFTVSPSSNTTYRAKVYANSSFLIFDHIVEVSNFNINTQVTDFICNLDSVGTISALNLMSEPVFIGLSNPSGEIIEYGALNNNVVFNPPGVGNYLIVATDLFGCSQYYPVSISSLHAPMQLNLSCVDSISCTGNEIASIIIDQSTNISTITSMPSLDIINGIAQTNNYGNYTFTATDTLGCIISQIINVPSYNAIQSINFSQFFSNQTLQGEIIITNVNGGTAPYEYSIDGGALSSNSQFDNLGVGTYTIIVQDNNGCTYSENVNLNNNSNSTINLTMCSNAGLTLELPNTCNLPGSPISGFVDDNVRGSFPIGFDFCYYGNTYHNFYIGSNGWVGFSPGQSGTWVSNSIPNSNSNMPKNAIFGPFHDINPSMDGQIKMQTIGEAPNRKLVVSFCQIPHFACNSYISTSQIVLHETTNYIDTYIFQKPICTNWNGGNAIHGIQNSTGTAAIVVPGRNNTNWQAYNEGMRFIPSSCNGPVTYSLSNIPFIPYTIQNFSWYQLPNLQDIISTSSSLNVNPSSNTIYRCIYTIGNSAYYQDFLVSIQNPELNIVTTDFICNSDTNGLAVASINGQPPFTYIWQNSNNDTLFVETTNSSNSNFSPPYAGNFHLEILSGGNCFNNTDFIVGSFFPQIQIDSIFTEPVSCYNNNIGNIQLYVNGNNENFTFFMPNGIENNTGLFQINSPGNYFISITDTNNCILNQNVFVPFVDGPSNLNYSIENENCDSLASINILDIVGGASPYTFLLDGLAYQVNTNTENISLGFHVMQITDANGCSFTQQFYVPSLIPSFSINIWQSNDSLFVANIDSVVYNWYSTNDSLNILSTNHYFVPQTEGSYYVTATNQYGCSIISDSFNFIFNSITTLSKANHLKIFPNPANEYFYVESNLPIQIEMTDAIGKIFYNENKFLLSQRINCKNLSSGVYFIKTTFNDNSSITTKLLIH